MNIKRIMILVLAVGCLCLVMSAVLCLAEGPVAPGRAVLDKLLKAVETNDYNNFVADGNDAFKAGITKQIFKSVSAELAPRIKKGYECLYLGQLKQQGYSFLLWKLTFKDGGDDLLVKFSLKDDKVAGFMLQ